MYVLTVVATTTEKHPEYAVIGEAYVVCWIDRPTEEDAIAVAHEMIEDDEWNVVRTEEISVVNSDDYEEDDEYKRYYDQALIDKEVLLFNVCPRFPVYYISFVISSSSAELTADEARVWIANECVFDGHDPMAEDFWSGNRLEEAIAIAREAISENGYEIERVLDQLPCSRDESSDDHQFYDDAEEDGLCLVLVHEAPDDAE